MYPPRNKKPTQPHLDNFHSKKNALIKKILDHFIKRNKTYPNTNKLELEGLKTFLNSYISLETLQNFEYDKFLTKIERDYREHKLKKVQEGVSSEEKQLNTSPLENYIKIEELVVNTNSPQSAGTREKKTKLEILKNLKEKDDWAIIAKKNYENLQIEMKKKKIQQNTIRKDVNKILCYQIEEKNQMKVKLSEENKAYENVIKQDYQNWVHLEEEKQREKHGKVETLVKSIDKFKNCNLN